jgi:hypothetical protein
MITVKTYPLMTAYYSFTKEKISVNEMLSLCADKLIAVIMGATAHKKAELELEIRVRARLSVPA